MQALLRMRGTAPYLIAMFLNAMIDLGHKIILQNSLFKLYDGSQQILLTAVVNALILLPYILLLSPAGYFSDRYPKHTVMRVCACSAVVLTSAITLFYCLGWFWLAFSCTFLLAAQSALYSPAKFSYLKFLFGKARLAEGNGLVQAVSIVAILTGTFAFSLIFEAVYPTDATSSSHIISAMAPAGFALIISSLIECWLTFKLPALDKASTETTFVRKEYLRGQLARRTLSVVTGRVNMRLAVFGLSLFWGLGQVLLASYPAYAKSTIGITNTVLIQGILACTAIGIALGAATAARVSRGYIETGLIPLGALGISVGLWIVSNSTTVTAATFSFLAIGFSGGLFIVPLNALLQYYASDDEIGRVISASNWIKNVVMLSLLVMVFAAASFSISAQHILIAAALVATFGSAFTVFRLPQSLARYLLASLIRRRYSVNVEGMRNIPESGGVMLLGNHVSWMDWAIVQIASPRPIRFVMTNSVYKRWYLKPILRFFGCIPIERGASSRVALEEVAKRLNQGEVVCLFPEGTLSRTGHMLEFRRGFERACELADDSVQIVPFYVKGLWGSQFSYAKGNLRDTANLRREIWVSFDRPLPRNTSAIELKQHLFDLSAKTWGTYSKNLPNLTQACLQGLLEKRHKTVVTDVDGNTLSGAQLITAATLFSKEIRKSSATCIGIMLPSSSGAMIANLAVLLAGKTPVNLNFTASPAQLTSAIDQAGIKEIYTANIFLAKLKKKGVDLKVSTHGSTLIAMEDLGKTFGSMTKLFQLACATILPKIYYQLRYRVKHPENTTATILFSSGSEGTPKGVMLSHKNVMSNIKQVQEVLNSQDSDVMIASLPPFHAFGLTVSLFMPLVEGISCVCQPDPTNARATAKLISAHEATMLFGSSTFLRLYLRDTAINPLMLESLRVVVAGAEKLRADVREGFRLKFGKDILEGYGATETSPVASVNIPDQLSANRVNVQRGNRTGSVGMPVPGSSYKIVDPDTWQELDTGEEGMILITGPQLMLGYLGKHEETLSVMREINGMRWYVTGDKGRLDEDGFLWVVDRYSRFAKLGGEMISLGAVETLAQWATDTLCQQQSTHSGNNNDDAASLATDVIATTVEDSRKGESLVLLTNTPLDKSALRKAMQEAGASPLMLPDNVIVVEALPKLGSGKPNYKMARDMAIEHT